MCLQAAMTHAGQEAADSAQEALQCTVHVAAKVGTADSITSLQQVGPVSVALPPVVRCCWVAAADPGAKTCHDRVLPCRPTPAPAFSASKPCQMRPAEQKA